MFDVEAVVWCVFPPFGAEFGKHTVSFGNELHNGLEGHHVVRRSEGLEQRKSIPFCPGSSSQWEYSERIPPSASEAPLSFY